ncbi:hypothetical protein D9M68_843020 [compost metagenome]
MRNFASSSDGRPPKRRKKRGVIHGSSSAAAVRAATKLTVFRVNGAKISPSATTVARSVTKQAASTTLPNSVVLISSSSITA